MKKIFHLRSICLIFFMQGYASESTIRSFTEHPIVRFVFDELQSKEIRFTGHTGQCASLDFSPIENHALTASSDKTARLWHIKTGKCLAILAGHKNSVSSASFNQIGNSIVTTSYDGTAKIWSINKSNGSIYCDYTLHHQWPVIQAHFDSASRLLVTLSKKKSKQAFCLTLWDCTTGKKCWRRVESVEIIALAFQGPAQIVFVGADLVLRKLSTAGKLFSRITLKLRANVSSCASALDPLHRYVAVGFSDGIVELWNLKKNRYTHCFEKLGSAVESLMFDRKGTVLVAVTLDSIVLWSMKTFNKLLEKENDSWPLAIHTDASMLADSFDSHTPRMRLLHERLESNDFFVHHITFEQAMLLDKIYGYVHKEKALRSPVQEELSLCERITFALYSLFSFSEEPFFRFVLAALSDEALCYATLPEPLQKVLLPYVELQSS